MSPSLLIVGLIFASANYRLSNIEKKNDKYQKSNVIRSQGHKVTRLILKNLNFISM